MEPTSEAFGVVETYDRMVAALQRTLDEAQQLKEPALREWAALALLDALDLALELRMLLSEEAERRREEVRALAGMGRCYYHRTNRASPCASVAAMGGRSVASVVALLILGACSTWPAPSTSSNQASLVKVAFKKGGTYRYHYTSHVESTIALGQILSLPITADSSGDATWKIVSVDASGDTTVDLTLSNLKTRSTSSFPPGSTTTTTITTTTTREFQFKVASTGEIVSGGGPMVLPPALSLGQGLGLPGTDQLLAILPGRPVGPGDTWTKTFTLPGPFGQASITYTTTNRFLRYENLKSGRAAVIETTTAVPVDVTVDFRALAQGIASAGSPSPPPSAVPASGQVRLQGTSTTVSTTWFDTKTDQVEKVISVSTSDVTSSITGALLPWPIALPSLPPGILPVSPGPVPPGVLGSQHFTSKQTLEFDLLT